MLGNLPDNVKIHTSEKPISKLRSTSQKNYFKPNGLWYACGQEWIDWAEENLSYGDYIYLVHIKDSQILHLDSAKDLLEFTAKYGGAGPTKEWIDWKKVASKYGGVEICPYQWSMRMELMWYYPWDVASGCIWKSSAMELEYLGYWDGKNFIPGDNSRIVNALADPGRIVEQLRLARQEVEAALRCRRNGLANVVAKTTVA
jgi:hypothetical protein